MPLPRIRAEPEDFVVEEIPVYEPAGSGPHTWCWVEKRLRTTDDVVTRLAAVAGVAPREVGFAGRKDRRAVTRQWISVPGLDPGRAERLADPGMRVLRAVSHRHRLHLGDLLGNRFRLRVRDLDAVGLHAAREAWDELRARGLPNRFGRQRFGRDGGNAERGRRALAGETLEAPPRRVRLYLSALQAEGFNEILHRRPVPRDQALPGDLLVEHATGALRPVRDPGEWTAALASFDVSPTAPLFGPKARRATGLAGRLEREALAAVGVPDPLPGDVLRRFRISGERRAIRVPVGEGSFEPGDGLLDLSFVLPPGSYASVLLDEVLAAAYEEVLDGGAGDEGGDHV